jgi:hypothetical protein
MYIHKLFAKNLLLREATARVAGAVGTLGEATTGIAGSLTSSLLSLLGETTTSITSETSHCSTLHRDFFRTCATARMKN